VGLAPGEGSSGLLDHLGRGGDLTRGMKMQREPAPLQQHGLEELGQASCLCQTPGTSPPAAAVLAARRCAKIRAQAAEAIAARAGSMAPETPLPSRKASATQTLTGFVH